MNASSQVSTIVPFSLLAYFFPFLCPFRSVSEFTRPRIFKWSYSFVTLHIFSPLKSCPFFYCPHKTILTQPLWLNFFSKSLGYISFPHPHALAVLVVLQPFHSILCSFPSYLHHRECNCWLSYLPFSSLPLTFACSCPLFSSHPLLSLVL